MKFYTLTYYMKNIYEKLRKRVYEIIYKDGIPLTIGCEFRCRECKSNDLHIVLDEIDNNTVFATDSMGIAETGSIYYGQDMREILGPPLSLQDLLRALRIESKKNINMELNIDLSLSITTEMGIIVIITGTEIKDQEQKVLKKFYNLIREYEEKIDI